METNETIVAISTGLGSSAISIVRLSGKDAVKIADKIFVSQKNNLPSSFQERKLVLGKVQTSNFNEQAMCVVFKGPKSYTGEDMVEFQCHGGSQISNGILRECLACGARLATNGEFTKRAFMNGKMTLSSAEGMMDMINAESDSEIRAGFNLLSGKLSKTAFEIQNNLTDILSEIEVSFDYPEETIEFVTKAKIEKTLNKIHTELSKLLATCSAGKLLKSGINVAIIGKPNVGKSSLLNCLVGKDKAIVTDIAGTTRDSVEDTIIVNDIKINLIDTAGIRDTDDKVEQIGVNKAKQSLSHADIILFLVDSNRKFDGEDQAILDSLAEKNFVVIKTKCDLPCKCEKHFDGEILISSTTESGIDKLKDRITENAKLSNLSSESVIITNERHKNALENADKHILIALENLQSQTLDLISIDIKQAYLFIGEITGNTTSEDIIDAIFSKFCLGK